MTASETRSMLEDRLNATFPGSDFRIATIMSPTDLRLTWTDGPTVAQVAAHAPTVEDHRRFVSLTALGAVAVQHWLEGVTLPKFAVTDLEVRSLNPLVKEMGRYLVDATGRKADPAGHNWASRIVVQGLIEALDELGPSLAAAAGIDLDDLRATDRADRELNDNKTPGHTTRPRSRGEMADAPA